jgi:thiol:disulfide interchange protein DsbD
MRQIIIILALFLTGAAPIARAAHTRADLLLAADSAAPGDTVLAGVRLKMEPGWHTYWKNPGSAGQATEIKWQLPPGVTTGEIQWPVPEKIPPFDVTTYGYDNEVVLLVPLTFDKSVPAGKLHLAAKVSWLECKESCIPASGDVSAVLTIASETRPSASAPLLAAWQAKVPVAAADFSARAWWENTAEADTRMLNLSWTGKPRGVDFFPDANDDFDIQGATESLSAAEGQIHLRKAVKKFSGGWPKDISGVFLDAEKAVQAKVSIGDAPAPAAVKTTTPAQPLWRMLIYAFIGGLILNIMPCVLPVIALKILGFVNEAQSKPRRVRALGLVYALGVFVSFLVLAAVVIGVKTAGRQAGWGMQFGNPVFLVCLTTLVTLVALNLFGLFEVTLGGRALDKASDLSSKHGMTGAFFNGVLATALATPCTAPFLSIALGFAFAQSTGIILLVFAAVAAGLASPYVLLSWHPAWLKFLPKPGAWMEKFKIAMGFPMLATAVWLLNLAGGSYGKNILWLGVFLVLVAAAAWVFGEFVQRGRTRRAAAAIVVMVLLAGSYVLILEKELNWRYPVQPPPNGSLKESPDGIDWQPWSTEAVNAARAAGKIVLVDFTADWCLTCQVNKKTSIEIPSVREKIRTANVVALLGDYTRLPAAITTELNRFDRAGVPLVLVYPGTPDAAPVILPEVLTPGIVLEALDQAAK